MNNNQVMKKFWDYWDKIGTAIFSIAGGLVVLAIFGFLYLTFGLSILGILYNFYELIKLSFT